ncbi:MAG: Slp family lipoprotein [Nitrospirales bacterium]|nr:Slp family lipoprotein [Nitrospirales bacterium]
MKFSTILSILCLAIIFNGCSRYNVVPDKLESKVNHTLKFEQIRENPEQYKGEVVVVGGEVLSIKREQNATRIVVLQLPLNDDFIPADQRTKTQGRFIALSKGKDPLDPAVLEKEKAISIVGEIIGFETIQVGEDEKKVPVFGIKDLTIWDEARYWGRGYSGYGGRGWGMGYPYGHYMGYRPFGYPYY